MLPCGLQKFLNSTTRRSPISNKLLALLFPVVAPMRACFQVFFQMFLFLFFMLSHLSIFHFPKTCPLCFGADGDVLWWGCHFCFKDAVKRKSHPPRSGTQCYTRIWTDLLPLLRKTNLLEHQKLTQQPAVPAAYKSGQVRSRNVVSIVLWSQSADDDATCLHGSINIGRCMFFISRQRGAQESSGEPKKASQVSLGERTRAQESHTPWCG